MCLARAVFNFRVVVSVSSAFLDTADDSQHTILFDLSREVIDDTIGENSDLINIFLQRGLRYVCRKFDSKLAFVALKAPFLVL